MSKAIETTYLVRKPKFDKALKEHPVKGWYEDKVTRRS